MGDLGVPLFSETSKWSYSYGATLNCLIPRDLDVLIWILSME